MCFTFIQKEHVQVVASKIIWEEIYSNSAWSRPSESKVGEICKSLFMKV